MHKREFFIGIPVLNRFDLLKKALRNCDKWNAEILIINNSTSTSLSRDMEIFADTNGCDIMHSQRNLGVAASWNLIIKEGIRRGYDQIVISSDDTLISNSSIECIKKMKLTNNEVIWHLNVWNLFIIHRSAIDKVGWFDENFFPAYYEDIDYSYRCDKLSADAIRVFVVDSEQELRTIDNGYKKMNYKIIPELKTTHLGSQSRKKNSLVWLYISLHFKLNHFYYMQKWGGLMYDEQFKKPFNKDEIYMGNYKVKKNLIAKILLFRKDIWRLLFQY